MEWIWSFLVAPLSITTNKGSKNRFYVGWEYDCLFASLRIREFKKNGPQAIGRGRKGRSTKIHGALSPGCIKSACLSQGQRVDMKVFPTLGARGNGQDIQEVIADKGEDFYSVRKIIVYWHNDLSDLFCVPALPIYKRKTQKKKRINPSKFL